MKTTYQTIAVENYARRSINYLENMVDSNGLPYFNIFWTEPAQAAHDWPDFGDVMSRQFQAAIMARIMTGAEVATEKVWRDKILALIDPITGLLTRPATNYSSLVADPGDNALTLYSLVTAYQDQKDEGLRRIICGIVDGMRVMLTNSQSAGGWLGGFGIKSAMVCARYLEYEPALDLASAMVDMVFNKAPLFTPDNTFRHGGHMHGNLRTLVGAADYALFTKDPVLYSQVDALYRYVRSEATDFGFLPEAIGRKGDIVSCETCALMDYLGLAITLANQGHPEYWEDVEKIFRNHLIKSQVVVGSWLDTDSAEQDTFQFSFRSIGERMVGGYAGWSSPNHILAAKETLNAHWGGPELRDKVRAFQNCCGGSGTHAFYEVWKNASRFQNGILTVNLHIDKSIPQAEIRGFQPYQGLLSIHLKESCRVKVRIPDFLRPDEVKVVLQGKILDSKVWGNYLDIGDHQAGDEIRVIYPLHTRTDVITIGNPGFRQYHYEVSWKGSTVVKMEPLDNEFQDGYSEFDRKRVKVFYGKDGPGQLYLREQYIDAVMPEEIQLSTLQVDRGSLDFWYLT